MCVCRPGAIDHNACTTVIWDSGHMRIAQWQGCWDNFSIVYDARMLTQRIATVDL